MRVRTNNSPLVTCISLLLRRNATTQHKDVYATCLSVRGFREAPWLPKHKGTVNQTLRTLIVRSSAAYSWVTSDDFLRAPHHWTLPVMDAFRYRVAPKPVEFARVKHRGCIYAGRDSFGKECVQYLVAYSCGVSLHVLSRVHEIPYDSAVTRTILAASGLADDPRTLLWLISPEWSKVTLPAPVWEPWYTRWPELYDPFKLLKTEAQALTGDASIYTLLEGPRTARLKAPSWSVPHG